MSTKRLSWKRMEAEARKVAGPFENQERLQLATVLLASAVEGPRPDVIAKWSGYPRAEVRRMGRMLRRRKLWVGRHVEAADWFGKDGGIAFTMDVCVAFGLFNRVMGKRTPETA